MAITSAGIGSGLDINGLVTQLMTLESRPLQVLNQKEARLQARISAYGTLRGAMSSFNSTMLELNSPDRFNSIAVSVNSNSVVTATANASATPGSFSIEVQQLAQAQKLVSSAITDIDEQLGTGTLTIQTGRYSESVFTPSADKVPITISIDPANNTLEGVRDAINNGGAGQISASLLNDGTGYRLVITSTRTGESNSLKITVNDSGDGNHLDNNGLSRLAFDPAASAGSGKNLTETLAARDALMKVDGIENIHRANNRIDDLIDGVELVLDRTSEAGIVSTVTLTRNSDAVTGAVNSFARSYNDLVTTISKLTAYNAGTGQASILQGDASTLSIESRVRNVLNFSVPGGNTAFQSLSAIGLSIQRDGRMSVDQARLQTVVSSDINGITALFATIGRTGNQQVTYLGAGEASVQGSYSVVVDQAATRGRLTGNTTTALTESVNGLFDSPFVINAENDSFRLRVDGVDTDEILLAHGSYTTPAELASLIQAAVNQDSRLLAAGVQVSVLFDSDNDALTLRSARYGSASSIALTAVDTQTLTTFGWQVATGTAGTDIQGSLGGITAIGSGQTLRGAAGNGAEGILLQLDSGTTGAHGTIEFSRGYADRLSRLMSRLLDEAGPVSSRTDGLMNSIDDIERQREAITTRLVATERRIRAQFAALDSLIGRLQSTSAFLGQQLASIGNLNNRNN